LFVVLFIALMTRAFQLQVLSGTALKGIAARQHTSFLTAHPERGVIFDRNGEKLAASILTDSVCADPPRSVTPGRPPRASPRSSVSIPVPFSGA
jgi:cell division protein FtsI/penicillin-binding protein 2